MIIVAGSRHDPVAQHLVRRWPGAALCGADDLTTRGWVWPATSATAERIWVLGGARVPDGDVTGVFLRRSGVYADEFPYTHPDDRDYLAAEAHAFLVFVLATTGATVINPVVDGALGVDALRPERWMPVAARVGLAVAPLRLASGERRPPPEPATIVEVVGGKPLAAPSAALTDATVTLANALHLEWAVAAFDDRGHLSALSTTHPPSAEATDRLGHLLVGRAA